MPVIDGGGMDEVARQLEFMARYLDAVNATDNAAAHAHASPLAVSLAIRECGVEPIMQLVCRDRNRLALEADIIGASLHGIENLCCLTGDDVTAGDEPEARRVFDLDSVAADRARRAAWRPGRYLSGRAIEPAPELFIGAVENPGAPPYDYRVRRAAKKALAGARYLQLQLCFEPERLEAFMARRRRSRPGRAGRDHPERDHRPRRRRAALHRRARPRHLGARRHDRARAAAADDQLAGLRGRRLRARPARHVAARRRRLHFISFRRDAGIARLCAAPRHPDP